MPGFYVPKRPLQYVKRRDGREAPSKKDEGAIAFLHSYWVRASLLLKTAEGAATQLTHNYGFNR